MVEIKNFTQENGSRLKFLYAKLKFKPGDIIIIILLFNPK